MFRSIIPIAAAWALFACVSLAETFYPAWSKVYDNQVKASQFARAIGQDSHGHVFVAGHVEVSSARQLYVAKYDTLDGHLLWQRTIVTGGTNQYLVNALAVDRFDNCIVVGSRNLNGAIDYYVHKFAGLDGANFWDNGGGRTYDGSAGGSDIALKVVTSSTGDIYVTGRSAGSGSGDDIVTVKFARDTGNTLASDRYSPTPGTFNDFPGALAIDSVGNVIVGGVAAINNSTERFAVRKLNSNLGVVWTLPPKDLGGEGGVTGLAVDSGDNIIATGLSKNLSDQFGYYTVKLAPDGSQIWQTGVATPSSGSPFGSPRPSPIGVAIGPDDCPVVTGTLLNGSGAYYVCTMKYLSSSVSGYAAPLWGIISANEKLGTGDTLVNAIQTDRDGNIIIAGSFRNQAGNSDIFVTKYASFTGEQTWLGAYGGSTGAADSAVGLAVDHLGRVSVLADFGDKKEANPNESFRQFATLRLNRFIAVTKDTEPNGIAGVPADATFATGNTPALADQGTIVAKVTLASGPKKIAALLQQGAGGTRSYPAAQGQPAPGMAGGTSPGNWVSFSDPVIAPEGTYAFAAKITGPAAKANGLWTNASGALRLVLQQGTPLTGVVPAVNVVSIISYTMRNNDLLALVKLSGPPATSTALLRVADGGQVSVLLRSGEPNFTLNGKAHTIKSFTTLSPAPASPGDGRWDGEGAILMRALCAQSDNPKITQTAILRIATTNASSIVVTNTGKAANEVAAGASYKTLGLPAIGDGGVRYAFAATVAPLAGAVTTANDAALVYTPNAVNFNVFAREGGTPPGVEIAGAIYAAFSDPLLAVRNGSSEALFLATVKGPGLTAANNRVLMYGNPTSEGGPQALAHISGTAAKPATEAGESPEPATRYSAFLAFALPSGVEGGPIFVAKLSGATAKNNVGLFARDSMGNIRRLLRTGDNLGGAVVKSMNLLKAVPKAFAAARSFNSSKEIVVQVVFTDNRTALLPIAIP